MSNNKMCKQTTLFFGVMEKVCFFWGGVGGVGRYGVRRECEGMAGGFTESLQIFDTVLCLVWWCFMYSVFLTINMLVEVHDRRPRNMLELLCK